MPTTEKNFAAQQQRFQPEFHPLLALSSSDRHQPIAVCIELPRPASSMLISHTHLDDLHDGSTGNNAMEPTTYADDTQHAELFRLQLINTAFQSFPLKKSYPQRQNKMAYKNPTLENTGLEVGQRGELQRRNNTSG